MFALVGSTEAAKGVFAHLGGIDRSRLGSSEYGVIGPNQIHIIDDGIPDERGVRVQDAAPLGVGPSSGSAIRAKRPPGPAGPRPLSGWTRRKLGSSYVPISSPKRLIAN